uniref:Aminotransferase-like plant mobile domain-containing protein n=1 Tax=Solanum lycopersicum TaxID=4081 RepID=A0A3Q7JB16_SOLLC
MILNTRREDGNFWKLIEKYLIHPRVLEVIRISGLYGVYKFNQSAINRSLIIAQVERRREATITLQDVGVLYGLPLNGDPVLGNEMIRTIGDWQNICQRLLGFVPSREDFKPNSIKVAAFNSHMLSQPQLPNMATKDMVNQKARYYMFWMIAASQSNQNEIAGFLPLLQRVIVLRPQIVAHIDARTISHVGFPRVPQATRWFPHLSWTNTTKHVLKVYRDALDSMIEDQVHLPDRLMRQFGLQQAIPTPLPFDSHHFRHDHWGRPHTKWELEHAHWLSFWNQRLQYSCDAPILVGSEFIA